MSVKAPRIAGNSIDFQQFIQASNRKSTNAPHYWQLERGVHEEFYSPHKEPVMWEASSRVPHWGRYIPISIHNARISKPRHAIFACRHSERVACSTMAKHAILCVCDVFYYTVWAHQMRFREVANPCMCVHLAGQSLAQCSNVVEWIT